jgi:hypothetical protein
VTVPEGATSAAWTAYDILMQPEPPPSVTFTEPLEISAQLVRQWAVHCRSGLGFSQVFGHALAVAETLNPHLHPSIAAAPWRLIGDSPCARALAPDERLWLDLFGAVAARDAARMTALGIRALQAQPNARGPATEYAFMAAVSGAIHVGDIATAKRLLSEGTKKWLRPGQRGVEMSYLFNLATSREAR